MSQEDVDFVLRAVEAFNARDQSYLREVMAEEFEFVSVLSAVAPGGTTYRGTDAWDQYFADMDKVWENWHVENYDVLDAGAGSACGIFELTGTGRASGIEARKRIGITYELRDDRIWRMRSYLDPDEALAAVGIPSGGVYELAAKLQAAFNSGPDAYANMHTEDVVHETAPEWPEAGTYRGREAVRKLWAQIFEVHERATSSMEQLIQVDDNTFITRNRLETRGLTSGTAATTTVFMFTRLRGELIERVEYFLDEDEALAAAGLEPRT